MCPVCFNSSFPFDLVKSMLSHQQFLASIKVCVFLSLMNLAVAAAGDCRCYCVLCTSTQ